MTASVVNINDVLDGHVALSIDCVDRVYLNAYVPGLQVGGQVNIFLERHLGFPLGSPAIIEKIGNRFRRDVKAFAATNAIPILALKKPDRSRWNDRKLDHVRPYLDAAEHAGRFGVVAIVVGQEFQWVHTGEGVEVVEGALGVPAHGDQCPRVRAEQAEPRGEVRGVIEAGGGYETELGAPERGAEFGDEFLTGVGAVTESARQVTPESGRVPGPVDVIVARGGVEALDPVEPVEPRQQDHVGRR